MASTSSIVWTQLRGRVSGSNGERGRTEIYLAQCRLEMKIVVSTVDLEGPTPISTCEGLIFDVITLGF